MDNPLEAGMTTPARWDDNSPNSGLELPQPGMTTPPLGLWKTLKSLVFTGQNRCSKKAPLKNNPKDIPIIIRMGRHEGLWKTFEPERTDDNDDMEVELQLDTLKNRPIV